MPRGARQAVRFKAPRMLHFTSQNVPVDHIYFTTRAQFTHLAKSIPDARLVIRVLDDLAVDVILNRDDFPQQIAFHYTGQKTSVLKPDGNAMAIAIINGMGNGIGDSIVGLRALDIFYNRVQVNCPNVSIDVFRRINPELRPLYQRNKSIHKVWDLPYSLAELLRHDYLMSLEAFTLSSEFNAMPMIDYFLAKLGLDPQTVADHEKRGKSPNLEYCINHPDKSLEKLLQRYKEKGSRLLLIHPFASDILRSMPHEYIAGLIDYLICNTDFTLVSAVDTGYRNDRLLDLSRQSKNLDDFVYIIARMDAVITVDTSAYHIADCFDVPTVVLFNSINPQYRLSYYPHVRGIWLGEDSEALRMRHKGFTEQDEPILKDIYENFDYRKVLFELDAAKKSVQTSTHQ